MFDDTCLHMPATELEIEAADRRAAAVKLADLGASRHLCELDPGNGVTACGHPHHDRDADLVRVALDMIGVGQDNADSDTPAEVVDLPGPTADAATRRSRITFERPDLGWQDHGNCRDVPIWVFFGAEGERGLEKVARERRAEAICRGCPVKALCLDHAMSMPEKYGTWGGLNEDERASERRRRMRKVTAA